MLRNYLFLILTLLLPIFTQAQIEGLWIVTKVQVEEGSPTPVARWFHFFEDRSVQSGTAMDIDLEGHWKIQQDQLYLLDEDSETILDGPFTVRLDSGQMYWTKITQGLETTVKFTPSELIPMASWDHLYGDWQIAEIWNLDTIITQDISPRRDLCLSIGWDHQFTIYNGWHGPGEQSGHWAIPYSSLKLSYYNPEIKEESWWIRSVSKDRLVLQNSCSLLPVKKMVFRRWKRRWVTE